MTPEMLPVLHLRRQAASFGWRLAKASGSRHDRMFAYERVDEDGTHRVWVDAGYWPKPGEEWGTSYRSASFRSEAGDGFLAFEHVSEQQAVGIVRAYFGWSS